MHFIKKTFVTLIIITILFSGGLSPALAFSMDGGELAEGAVKKVMEMFGADMGETKKAVQSMNVSRQKKTPPQVDLTFTPASPVPGSQITASATASYFISDPTSLYYTWYLKRGYCTGDYVSRCDLNNDKRMNIADYKIEAMRLIANGGFDWQRAMGKDAPLCLDASVTTKPDYCNDANQYSITTSDGDGYEAVFGGEEQRGRNSSYCYLHDFSTGNEFEFNSCDHLFPHAPYETTGDNVFTKEEEAFWHTNPNSKDTTNTGTLDEAAVAGLGMINLTWNYVTGDKVGVVVEGASVESTTYQDATYKIMWAMPKNDCDIAPVVDELPEDSSEVVTSDATYEYSGIVLTALDNGDPYEAPTQDKIITQTTTNTTYSQTGDETIETVDVVTIEKRYAQVITNPFDPNPITNPVTYSTTSTDTILEDSLTTTTIDITDASVDVSELNDCLEDNLVEPSEGTADKKMEVSLSYLPDFPVNSESGDNADQLVIQSSILSAGNRDFINYAWEIYLSSDIAAEDSDWKMLTLPELAEQKTNIKKLSGIGLDSLKINLNFEKEFLTTLGAISGSQKTFYAKIVLRAMEGSGEQKKEGAGTIIIPIQLSSNSLKVFSTNISDTLKVSLDTNTERCTTGMSAVICPIVKNEIIGVKFDISDPTNYDFLWSFDNKPVSETDQNIAYLPILAQKGTQQILSLTAINKVTGEKISLVKSFRVSDPTILITSANTKTCAPTLLGYYVDPINANPTPDPGLDASLWPDLSQNKFEALPGEIIQLKPFLNTTTPANVRWFIDDMQITTSNMTELGITEIKNDNTLVFTANKAVGEKYKISFGMLYTQSDLVKKALNAKWEVPQTNFYEKLVSQTIEVTVTDTLSSSGIFAQNETPRQKILASIFSTIPSYINFLFRVIITLFLTLFLVYILFSLFPEQKKA